MIYFLLSNSKRKMYKFMWHKTILKTLKARGLTSSLKLKAFQPKLSSKLQLQTDQLKAFQPK